jgi:hypothetical protein
MLAITLILLIVAAVCFALAAFNVAPNPRVNWLGLGLFFWVLVPLISTVSRL